jgi:[CysO sulfur-carrier protein]-S-L-cysteine hydrolase
VKIRKDVLEKIVAHAVEDLPNECCGLLIGTADMVEDASRARNTKRSRTRFQVEPADHFAAIRRARAGGFEIIGAYHSHPSGPSGPSDTDRVRLTDPSMFHVIVSLAHGTRTVRAFRLNDGNFSPLELVPVP